MQVIKRIMIIYFGKEESDGMNHLLTKVIFHFQFHVFFHYKTHTLVSHSLKSPFYSFFDSKKSSEKRKSMSCHGCRVLRKRCDQSCVLRPCLDSFESPEAKAHATLFVSKFFGRTDLINFITSVPAHKRKGMSKFQAICNGV